MPTVALCVLSHWLVAQETTGKEKTSLLLAAKARYYNLQSIGVKGFGCDVDVDWNSLFASAAGKEPAADDPMMKYLQAARLSFTNDLRGKGKVEWALKGVPPEGKEKAADELRSSLKQTLEGFLQAWTPFLNGDVIPQSPKTLKATPTGYVIDDGKENDVSEEVLDKDMTVKHLTAKTEALVVEMDSTFTSSPSGLLLTQMDATYQQPPTNPPTPLVMKTTFEPVDNFQLPATLTVIIPNVVTFKMRFTGCTVEK
jgi:hypothetical protein